MHIYAIAIGSNQPHGRMRPAALIDMAVSRIGASGCVIARAPILETAPIGPAQRRFANSALLLRSALAPDDLLHTLKAIERAMGRRRGRRWGSRVIDLDIALWSGGRWRSRRPALTIPHVEMARRTFVLAPLLAIAPGWRLPGSPLNIRHLAARLTRRPPVHRSRSRSGP